MPSFRLRTNTPAKLGGSIGRLAVTAVMLASLVGGSAAPASAFFPGVDIGLGCTSPGVPIGCIGGVTGPVACTAPGWPIGCIGGVTGPVACTAPGVPLGCIGGPVITPDQDLDDDGHDSTAYAGGTDCDDTDGSIHPGATDTPYDGIDSDCSGGSDYDADGDGYDAIAHEGTDCDDANAAVNPGATEVLGNGIDDDCNAATLDAIVIPEVVESPPVVAPPTLPSKASNVGEEASGTVTDPLGRPVSIERATPKAADTPKATEAPKGFALLTAVELVTFEVTAEPATERNPLRLQFDLSPASVLLASHATGGFAPTVTRNGVPVVRCAKPGAGVASPNPCIDGVMVNPDGSGSVLVLSSHASLWSIIADIPAGQPCPSDKDLANAFPDAAGQNVACLARHGIVVGHADGTFRPLDSTSRGQAATIIVRTLEAAGVELSALTLDAFRDDDGTTHESAFDMLVTLGIVRGMADGTSAHDANVTGQQLTAMLNRAYLLLPGATAPANPATTPLQLLGIAIDDGPLRRETVGSAIAALLAGYHREALASR